MSPTCASLESDHIARDDLSNASAPMLAEVRMSGEAQGLGAVPDP